VKKRNWLNRKAVVIIMIVYAVILLAFGPPFADRKLTQGLSRRVAYQDTSFSQVVYKTGGVALFAVVAEFTASWRRPPGLVGVYEPRDAVAAVAGQMGG